MATIETHIDAETHVAEIVLNRPGKRNAINEEMRDALLAAIATLSADQRVNCILLRANGLYEPI